MKALSSSPQRALLGALRIAVARDPWFAGWLDPTNGGPALVVEGFSCEPWASLTFAGARHHLALRLSGPIDSVEAASDRIEALLASGDLPLAGHFLAEVALGEREATIGNDDMMHLRIELEALTIED
jgi:hypothetical protein